MTSLSMARPMLRVRWTQALMTWWYGTTIHRRYKPLLRAEFAVGDPIQEARFLAHAGYLLAACSVARTGLERRFKRAAMLSPGWRTMSRRPNPESYSMFLVNQGLWRDDQHQCAQKLLPRLNRAVHGETIYPGEVSDMLCKTDHLLRELHAVVDRLLDSGC